MYVLRNKHGDKVPVCFKKIGTKSGAAMAPRAPMALSPLMDENALVYSWLFWLEFVNLA